MKRKAAGTLVGQGRHTGQRCGGVSEEDSDDERMEDSENASADATESSRSESCDVDEDSDDDCSRFAKKALSHPGRDKAPSRQQTAQLGKNCTNKENALQQRAGGLGSKPASSAPKAQSLAQPMRSASAHGALLPHTAASMQRAPQRGMSSGPASSHALGAPRATSAAPARSGPSTAASSSSSAAAAGLRQPFKPMLPSGAQPGTRPGSMPAWSGAGTGRAISTGPSQYNAPQQRQGYRPANHLQALMVPFGSRPPSGPSAPSSSCLSAGALPRTSLGRPGSSGTPAEKLEAINKAHEAARQPFKVRACLLRRVLPLAWPRHPCYCAQCLLAHFCPCCLMCRLKWKNCPCSAPAGVPHVMWLIGPFPDAALCSCP